MCESGFDRHNTHTSGDIFELLVLFALQTKRYYIYNNIKWKEKKELWWVINESFGTRED